MKKIENKLIKILDEADKKLTIKEFDILSLNIIDYIDEIMRNKREKNNSK